MTGFNSKKKARRKKKRNLHVTGDVLESDEIQDSDIHRAMVDFEAGALTSDSINTLQAQLGNQQVIQLLRDPSYQNGYPLQRKENPDEEQGSAVNSTTATSVTISKGLGKLDDLAKEFFRKKCLPMISHYSLLEKEMLDVKLKIKPLMNQQKYYKTMMHNAPDKAGIETASKAYKELLEQTGSLTEKLAGKKAMQEKIGTQLQEMLKSKRFFEAIPDVPDGIVKANDAGTKAAIASFLIQLSTIFVDDPEIKAEIQKAADIVGVVATIADPAVDAFIGTSQMLYGLAEAMFSEAKTVSDVSNDLIAGKMGPIHQGYAMIGDTVGAAITGQENDIGDRAAKGDLGTVAKVGADLGDALKEIKDSGTDAIKPAWWDEVF